MLTARTRTAMAMAFRDQLRRPLVLVLLVVVPAYVVIRSVAQTAAAPRGIELPDGTWIVTTMRAIHGPEMAKIGVAFVAALVGVFVMQSALEGDRRLVAAGFRARDVAAARLAVVAAATGVAVTVASVAVALKVEIASWPPVLAALILVGLIYAGIGALLGALLDRIAATYAILFLALTDLGVVQTPMFHASPSRWAPFLPGYGPTRVMFDGAYATRFHAFAEVAIALGWVTALAAAVGLVLGRALRSAR